ncbi:DNA alkylation repair enzyme [Aureliella helgolandensis]|uniref:DNA alkylation repair enzyme n=1 Tax=Aureliella helgolandensis TaxID=2527968 RepID=A0A518G0I0_9BACT|nr:DNA alkylation repair enzyme [Aureliella helgolandensis]
MTVVDILRELQSLGSPQTVKTCRRHGAEGEMYGVKISDLKKLVKRVKGNHALVLELWDTQNSDAMYLAALAADGREFTRKQLDGWAKTAWWYMLSCYAVPYVAAEHPAAFGIAQKWMKARAESVASAGWNTYALALAVRPDSELDFAAIQERLDFVQASIDSAANRVRYCMNGFVISVGCYVEPLLRSAQNTAQAIGQVQVDLADTACRVPLAVDAIDKVVQMGRVGRKRKSTKC